MHVLQRRSAGDNDRQVDVNVRRQWNVQRDVDKVLEGNQLRLDGQRNVHGDGHRDGRVLDQRMREHLIALYRLRQRVLHRLVPLAGHVDLRLVEADARLHRGRRVVVNQQDDANLLA
ncbi:hypothetical protein TYRP_004230 [Tyrophagus putrescentiae]|nr:hypothetical protein TYRP_004230 [Tyrophagus putrescentiae]